MKATSTAFRVWVIGCTAFAILTLSVGCHTRRTGLTIAPPKVYSDQVARQTLANQSGQVVTAARAVSASSLNQYRGGRQATGLTGRVQGAQGTVPGATTADPEQPVAVPSAADVAAIDLPDRPVDAPGADKFGSLFIESLDDVTAKEANIEAVRLLYQADTRLLGEDANLYLVRFDVSVDPVRQNYLTYPFRIFNCFARKPGAFPGFGIDCTGFQNYTKDYQAVVDFTLPSPRTSKESPPLEVYAIQPANQSLTTLESFAWANQLGIAGAYANPTTAAQLDYQNRIEEQFAEQRKYPLIRGVVRSPTSFRFYFNPRRRAVRRSALVSWIPLVGAYKTETFLEPGVRRVYAYVLVRNPSRYAKADVDQTAEANLVMDPSQIQLQFIPPSDRYIVSSVGETSWKKSYGSQLAGLPDEPANCDPTVSATESSRKGVADLGVPIVVSARYTRFGNPTRSDPLFFEDAFYPPKCVKEAEDSRYHVGARKLSVQLPLETGRAVETTWKITQSDSAELANIVNLAPQPCEKAPFFRTASAIAFLQDPASSAAAFHASASKLTWAAHGPTGDACSGALFSLAPFPERPKNGNPLKMRFYVQAGSQSGWTDELVYNGPWAAPKAAAAETPPQKGKAGSETTIKVPKKTDAGTIKTVHKVHIGSKVVTPNETDGKSSDHFSIKLTVPAADSPKVDLFADADVESSAGDKQVPTATKTERRVLKIGTFEYEQ